MNDRNALNLKALHILRMTPTVSTGQCQRNKKTTLSRLGIPVFNLADLLSHSQTGTLPLLLEQESLDHKPPEMNSSNVNSTATRLLKVLHVQIKEHTMKRDTTPEFRRLGMQIFPRPIKAHSTRRMLNNHITDIMASSHIIKQVLTMLVIRRDLMGETPMLC